MLKSFSLRLIALSSLDFL
ncbi:hypothetical protein Gotur_014069, partial [Gossypium turneri]